MPEPAGRREALLALADAWDAQAAEIEREYWPVWARHTQARALCECAAALRAELDLRQWQAEVREA